jgi:ABC-2 type transport system permease protein
VGFSSWAFLILGVPILFAYGIVAGVPWYYYPLLPIYLLAFVLLPSSLSAVICLVLVRVLPRNRKQSLMILGGVMVALVLAWLARVGLAAKESLVTGKRNEVEGLIGQFALTQHPLMPSHWMTLGLSSAARGDLAEAFLPLAMIASNGLIVYLLATWLALKLYRTSFDRMAGSRQGKKIYGGNLLDRIMEWLVFYLDRPTRILIVKDFRTFRRDPTQWVLLLIFGGLMTLGASNFRQYYRNDLAMLDQYVVSLVNLGATAVLLCAGLSRFIYPLMSLEGRKFWILGLMPIPREKVLVGKFAFAATGSLIIACGLTLVGDTLLGLPRVALVSHLITAAAIALGLSALNVGLGAYMPNFKETDPSKIVVGFGGTVNMVLGLMYLLLILAVGAIPMHVAGLRGSLNSAGAAWARDVTAPPPTVVPGELPLWAFAGLPIAVILCVVAIWLPLRAGSRALRNTEF